MRNCLFFFIAFFFIPCNAQKRDIDSYVLKADQLIGEGRYDKAIILLSEIEDEILSLKNDTVEANFNFIYATACIMTGKTERCISLYQKTLSLYKKIGYNGTNVFLSLSELGNIYLKNEDFKESEKFFRKAIISCYSYFLLEEDNPICLNTLLFSYASLAEVYTNLNENKLAEECVQKYKQLEKYISETE